jgi:hypothetical protein
MAANSTAPKNGVTPYAAPPFTNQVIAIARETKLGIALEGTITGYPPASVGAADPVMTLTPGVQQAADTGLNMILLSAAGTISQNLRRQDDIQYRNTRSRLKPIPMSFEAGKWNFKVWLHVKALTAPAMPLVPDINVLLTCGFGRPATTNSTRFGTVDHLCYELLGVVPGGTVYPSFTAWFQEGHTARYISGATVDQIDFEVGGNEIVTLTFSGEFMRHGWCGTDYVVSTVGAGSLVVNDPYKYFLAVPASAGLSVADALWIQLIDPSTHQPLTGWTTGAKVTDVSYGPPNAQPVGTLTYTGGGTATAGALVVPYISLPPEDTTYFPIVGKFGLVRIGSFVDNTLANCPSGTQVVNAAKTTLKNNIKYHTDIKDGQLYPSEYVVPGIREVTGELALFMYRNILDFNYKNLSDPLLTDYMVIPAQDRVGSPGTFFQMHSQVSYETPAITGEDEKTVTIATRGIATSAYDDELALVLYGAPPPAPLMTARQAQAERQAQVEAQANVPSQTPTEPAPAAA